MFKGNKGGSNSQKELQVEIVFCVNAKVLLIYTHKFSPAELLVYRKKIKSGGNIIFITYIILYIFLSVRAIFQ